MEREEFVRGVEIIRSFREGHVGLSRYFEDHGAGKKRIALRKKKKKKKKPDWEGRGENG